jgi:hypothetical protein
MKEFLDADSPCFALGLVEERQRKCGFLALRPDEIIPLEIRNLGFRFGHALLGTSDYTVIQFVFEFYGFSRYNVLINPNNPLVQTVLTTMVESGDYFFFVINANQTATAFRSDMGQENLVGLKTNLPRIQEARTTEVQYREALLSFKRNPQPAGSLLTWVCRDHAEYLDLTEDRLDLNPTS